MSTQSEAALEAGLIATLQQMDYEYVQIVEEDNHWSVLIYFTIRSGAKNQQSALFIQIHIWNIQQDDALKLNLPIPLVMVRK